MGISHIGPMGSMPGSPVKTVVIPVAGRGTRLLPATKAVRKELLPIGSKPLIQYAVEEARSSGIDQVVFVCASADPALVRYFERDRELEDLLTARGRRDEAESLAELGRGLSFSIAVQEEPRGLADAIGSARGHLGGRPFGVILPDALILGPEPCLGELIRCFVRYRGAVVATREVGPEETRRYGILAVDPEWGDHEGSIVRASALVEKPAPEEAPSLHGVFGRYVLPPEIFECIDAAQPDLSGEIQLTDALNLYCKHQPVYGAQFSGNHFDTGGWRGYAEATIACFGAELAVQTPG